MPLRKGKKKPVFRTVVPKKGVYLHVEVIGKGKKRHTEADILRRTKAHARATGKPRMQRLK